MRLPIGLFAAAAVLIFAVHLLIHAALPGLARNLAEFHSLIEVLGAGVAISGVLLYLLLGPSDDSLDFLIWPCAGLMTAGVLSLFHAVVRPGSGFFWLSSASTLAGGALFSLVLLPERFARTRFAGRLPWLAGGAALALGVLTLLRRDLFPVMVEGGAFTWTAKAMNFGGGLLFMAAGAGCLRRYRAGGRTLAAALASICLLFAAVGVLFSRAGSCQADWCLLDLVRLAAYGGVFGLMLVRYRRAVNEQRLTLTRMREGRDYLDNLITHANAPIIIWDPQFKITRLNRAFEALLGRKAGEVVGRSMGTLFPPDQAAASMEHLRKTLSGESLDVVEIGILHLDGTVRILLWNSDTIFAEDGKTPVAIVAQGQDITGSRRAEEAAVKAQRFSETVLDSISDAISIIDTGTYRVVDANAVFLKDAGIKKEEALKKYCYELTHRRASPCDGKNDPCPIAAMLSSGRPVTVEHVHYAHDGSAKYVEVAAYPLRDRLGQITMAIHIARDVTARRVEREKLEKIEGQLRQSQKMEAVGLLAGGVAHDFNNILTAITSYAEFIRRDLPPGDQKLADAQEILDAADRAAALTRQLLAFGRKQILSPRVVDLNKVAAGVIQMISRLIGENVKLTMEPFSAPCPILVDPGQMEQVIMNLAVNARDAMPKGGTIVVAVEIVDPPEEFFDEHPDLPAGPLVRLKVSDTGCGMKEEVRSRIFEPFFTTKEQGKGTGLGLSTVFGIVKQSGGEILVESEPGKGTTFSVYLPLLEACLRDKDREKVKEAAVKGHETVLFVEDEEGLRRLGERVLRSGGYDVLVAADARGALKLMEERGKPVDLLLTDVVMPGMNGRELALELARKKLISRTLYMSGYTEDAIVKHGVLEPGIAFIYKPFTLEAVLRKLREVLDGPADRAKA